MTAARGAAPRRGRRFARSRRFRPSERRFAWRAHTRSGRASRSRRSWRERFPTRPPSLDRSSPSSARIRGPKQLAALSRHRSRAPVSHRVHSEDGPSLRRIRTHHASRGLGARRAAWLSPQAGGGVISLTGDRGALRRALDAADRVPMLSPPFIPLPWIRNALPRDVNAPAPRGCFRGSSQWNRKAPRSSHAAQLLARRSP